MYVYDNLCYYQSSIQKTLIYDKHKQKDYRGVFLGKHMLISCSFFLWFLQINNKLWKENHDNVDLNIWLMLENVIHKTLERRHLSESSPTMDILNDERKEAKNRLK